MDGRSRWANGGAPSRITLLNHFDVLAPSGDDESWWSEGSKDFSEDLELAGVGQVIRPDEQVLLQNRRLCRFQVAFVDSAVVWSNTSLHVALLVHWSGQSAHVSLLILAFLIDVDVSEAHVSPFAPPTISCLSGRLHDGVLWQGSQLQMHSDHS